MIDFVSHDKYNRIMENNFLDTVTLIKEYNTCNRQLQALLWGAIEIREQNGSKYIYLHKRQGGMPRTEYVEAKLKRKGKVPTDLSEKVKLNIDFAKRNLVDTIYKQAVLEGVAVTFLETETIIEGGKVAGISADDVQKVNNLKHAWQFTLDEGVICSPSDYSILCYINRLVEEGFYFNAGILRSVPVTIGGTKWKPDLPIESLVKEQLSEVLSIEDVYERALNALLFVTKKQLFIDGNKRTAVIFANHILISNGAGIVVIPEDEVDEYKKLLIHYYETDEKAEILDFLYNVSRLGRLIFALLCRLSLLDYVILDVAICKTTSYGTAKRAPNIFRNFAAATRQNRK